jgi:hypothetical protein
LFPINSPTLRAVGARMRGARQHQAFGLDRTRVGEWDERALLRIPRITLTVAIAGS